MARSHARLLTSIWADDEFLALHAQAQRLYMLLLSQPDLSTLGTLTLSLKRLARLAPDTTPAKLRKALSELEEHFVVVDWETDELFVRSFMRHDGVLKLPNSFKAACRAFPAVHSDAIRHAILDELPDGLRDGFPDGFLDMNPSRLGERLKDAVPRGQSSSHQPPSANPSPSDQPQSSSSVELGEPPTEEEDPVDQALWALAEARLRANPSNVRNPEAWKRRVVAQARADGLDTDAARYLADYDGITPGQVAEVLDGSTTVLRHLRRREGAA